MSEPAAAPDEPVSVTVTDEPPLTVAAPDAVVRVIVTAVVAAAVTAMAVIPVTFKAVIPVKVVEFKDVPVVSVMKLPVSIFLTVAFSGSVTVAPVWTTVKVSVPAPPSRVSLTENAFATLPLKVSLPEVLVVPEDPTKTPDVSAPVVSVK